MTELSAVDLHLADEPATARLAARLAGLARLGDVILLDGPLGSGKTSFARAFIRARGTGMEEVPSPTFTLVETYAFRAGPPVWHFDLYRLEKPEEVWELGIEDAFADGLCLIEWPERLGGFLPAEHLRLALAPGDTPTARVVRLSATAAWTDRLADFADG